MTLRRTLRAVGLSLTGLVLVAVPAQASPGDAVAEGSVGSVDVLMDGEPIVIDPIAPCETGGPPQGSAGEVAVAGFISFASGSTECTIDDAGEVATAEITGGRFRLDGLRPHGGPRIRLSSFTAWCRTTLTGTSSWVQFSGLSGIDVPDELPPNYEVTIPGLAEGDPPLATVTLNETVVPDPPDGSMTVNLMHVRMFPEGPGPDGGDIVVGSVHCAPVS